MNKALLRYEMAKRNITVGQMAQILGISRSAFWKKCNGVSEFKQLEIKRMIDVLQPENPQAIFFADEVS